MTYTVSAQDVWVTITQSQRDPVEVDISFMTASMPCYKVGTGGKLFVKVEQCIAEIHLLAGEEATVRGLGGLVRHFPAACSCC